MRNDHPAVSGKLDSIQYLRFVAAGLVVLGHCYAMVPKVGRGDLGSNFLSGGSGVDIFFAISGFIMLVITQARERSPIDFVLRRLARVAPMYWLMTALTAVILIIAPAVFDSTKLDLPAFIASVAFFPWPQHGNELGAMPILPVGWTLNYEFLFYVLFAVAMAISHARRALIASMALMALVVAGLVFKPFGLRLQFYTSTTLIEFVFGMGIAHLYLTARLPRLGVSSACVIVGAIGLTVATVLWPVLPAGGHVGGGHVSPWRPLIWGCPAALIVLGGVGVQSAGKVKDYPFLRLLGDASYSTYLTHLFTIGAIRFLWGRLHLAQKMSDIVLLILGITAAHLGGYLAYQFVETPLVGFAQGLRSRVTRGARGTKPRSAPAL